MKQIAVYISNLSYRTDRRRSICKQFYHKQLFKIHIVPAIQHKTGAFGLWKTFLSIVAKERQNDSPYFVFCEDDHVFTEAYTDDFIMRRILWEVNTKYLLVNNKDIISTKKEINGHTQTVKNHILDGTIKLTYHQGGLRINLFGKLEWRRLNNIEGETTCLNMYGHSYGCMVNCQLPWKISFSPSIKYYRWHGYSANYMNQSSCIADVTISKLLLKEKIVIKIIGNDLFHQISNRKYVVNGQGQVETIYNRPPNYIMVSIGYRFDSITK